MKYIFHFIVFILIITAHARAGAISTLEDVPLNSRSDYYNGTNATPNSSDGAPRSANFSSGGFVYQGVFDAFGDGWVASRHTDTSNHQPNSYQFPYDAITGSGASGSATYAVAYGGGSVRVDLPAGQHPLSAQFTNTTYPYYSMLNGDSFAKKFAAGDWFKVTISGVDSGNQPTGTPVDFYLADFRSPNPASDYILNTWGSADLTPLGNASSLLFTLSSSDNGAFGMNTPAYFAMDNLSSVPEPGMIAAFGLILLFGKASMERKAFSLIELLVVIGIIALLMGILLPVLAIARASGKQALCASNIRQVGLAITEYANDNDGFYPPAHLDFVTQNLHRWHGTRPNKNVAFDFSTSCLKNYLETGQIKRCPEFVDLTPAPGLAFELGCGGYGYNEYMGCNESTYDNQPLSAEDYDRQYEDVAAKLTMIRRPADKILLADAAMAMSGGTLIEYSFIGAPLIVSGADSFPGTPSIHFRHRGSAVICWADGHVTAEHFQWTYPTNIYGADNNKAHLGYFGPKDNSLFDRD